MKMLIHIIKKEFQQFRRDPKMFGIILVAPIVQLFLLGYAATMDVDIVHTVIYDMDKSSESRRVIEDFESGGFFSIDQYADSYDEVTETLDNGDIIFALVIPFNFEQNIGRGETATIQAIFNGSDGNTASIAASYVQRIMQSYNEKVLIETMNQKGQTLSLFPSVASETRVWYNPGMESKYFMVPGILGLLLSIITLTLTSLAVVKEKEVGTLEQLIVTPIKSYHLIMGKLIPFIILSFAAMMLALAAMYIIFGIAIRGEFWFLTVSAFFYVLSTLGLGLLVSTVSKTQQQAMMISIFVVMMPMVFLSGFSFPIENMPEIIQHISVVVPLRYFITIIRSVILKGTGFIELWDQAAILLGMGIVILGLSVMRFNKRLD